MMQLLTLQKYDTEQIFYGL